MHYKTVVAIANLIRPDTLFQLKSARYHQHCEGGIACPMVCITPFPSLHSLLHRNGNFINSKSILNKVSIISRKANLHK